VDKKNSEDLTFSQRLEILIELLQRRPIRGVLEKLSTAQLVQAHNFLWNKMVEFHVRTQAGEFRREEVTKKMVPSAKYQRIQNCDLRIDYCKGIECIWSNPACAGNKVKNNMEVMAEQIGEYLFQ
jgi:fido (protein-threonine AMPylation protein)